MTVRSTAGPLALLAGLAILVAACGGGTATSAPGATTGSVVTPAPVTQGPAATDGGASFDPLASFHSDQDLENMLPDDLGGEAMTKLSMSGDDFLSGGTATEFQAALAALGKQPSDMSVALGGAGLVTILAIQVNGVPGNQILDALRSAFEANSSATITDLSFGGKSVKKFVPADAADGISYIYTAQDVVFVVGGEEITDALLNEAFSKLP